MELMRALTSQSLDVAATQPDIIENRGSGR